MSATTAPAQEVIVSPSLDDAVRRSMDHMLQEVLQVACTMSPHPNDSDVARVLRELAGPGAENAWNEFVEELGFV